MNAALTSCGDLPFVEAAGIGLGWGALPPPVNGADVLAVLTAHPVDQEFPADVRIARDTITVT